ncbi:MAG TPA: D-aminoacylase [Gemmatimonadaceae bacterium]|nr:D-aminoacylase [Gemmatimonadaceae bacterium]
MHSKAVGCRRTRRDFLAASATSLLALAGAPALVLRRAEYDLVLRGGTVFYGTGTAGVERDLAITGGRIVAVAPRIAERGTEEINARGLAVAPGFIDIHSHGDGSLAEDPRAESLVRQGITTIVVGQDGSSRAPSRSPGGGAAGGAGAARAGAESGSRSPQSFTELFAELDRLHPAVNVASMVGLGGVRGIVVGDTDRPATADELRRMTAMVEEALAQGACGASSGLEYTPGAFASLDELVALCKPLAARGLPYATHMRNEDDRLLEAIDESIAVARGARCPLQIAHLKTQGPRNWRKLDDVFARIAAARRDGLDVAFDRYPYIAYQTGLTNLFPVWSRDGGTDAFLARLADSSTAPRIRAEALAKVELIGGWNNVHIAGVRASEDKPAEGKRLGAYASSVGLDPYALTVAMLARNRASVGMVGFAMSEENLDRILAHPRGMVCSDGGSFAIEGPTRRGSPHPRGLGTFPRVLARYVRERRALTLEQAIHKMTALPASRVRLRDRGRLAVGLAADVVVFDPARVEDRATYEEPFQYPVGVTVVVVNGVLALRDGQRAVQGDGRALKPA